MQAYWLVVRVLLTPLEARKEKALTGLTPPAEAAASQKWKIIYLQVLSNLWPDWIGHLVHIRFARPTLRHHSDMERLLSI